MKIRKIETISGNIFLLTFVILTVFGMTEGRKKEYVYTQNPNPVFYHVSYEEPYENPLQNQTDTTVNAVQPSKVPTLSARSAALLSLDTGELLYGKECDIPLPIASTTKIMTALTVLQCGVDLNSNFTVPKEATGIKGSSIYIYEGEKILLKDLLYGLLLESGNDAATALAIGCGGSVENFVTLMNKNAQKMGLSKTHFKNPHGLTTEGHVSTAYELGRITFEAMKNETFRQIVATKTYSSTPISAEFPTHYFSNHNKLLRTLQGANGVKTGYTILSGRCLVSSTTRDGTGFIVVTLNDRNDWRDHTLLHEYGYQNYKTVRPVLKGELKFNLAGKELKNSEDKTMVIKKNETKIKSAEITLN